MSKFNEKSTGKTVVANYMGGKSFTMPEKERLAFAVLTTFLEDKYYESSDDRVKRIASLVKAIAAKDPLFVAKLAIVTRREFHMRSSSHVLVGELAKNHKGDSLVSKTVYELAERPDDLTEIVAYLSKPFPNQIKKGVSKALNKFDDYSLGRYRGKGKEVSLVDLFNLFHPKPLTETQNELYSSIVNDELRSRDTWEKKLSEGGDKTEAWTDLVNSGKLGYMALLRNLRNIIEHSDVATIRKALAVLQDPERVKKSKQLPFRFINAYEAVMDKKSEGLEFEKNVNIVDEVKQALEKAIDASIANIPALKGKTVILSDNSGSMAGDGGGSSVISAMSNTKSSSIANLFATMYWSKAENTYVGLFGDELINPELDRSKSLFDNFKKTQEVGGKVGRSTEHGLFTAFENLISSKEKVGRIIIFSDQQVGEENWYGHGGSYNGNFNKLLQEYRKISPETLIYSVDLHGYGNSMTNGGVTTMAGWSEKIFDIMEWNEKCGGLVKYIENYPAFTVADNPNSVV